MKSLAVVVLMKPVPDPRRWSKLKLDPETMLLCRSGIPPVINLLDRNAIEQAIVLKTQREVAVAVVTMAPPDAEEQLAEALAMGCEKAYLLSDVAFAGADTLATARTLAAAIRKIGHVDLVFCGASSLDGSTSQVGPQVAELLGIPDLTHCVGLEVGDGTLRATCALEDGHEVCECGLPALVTFDKEANRPRLPTMTGIMRAQATEITTWSAVDLGLAPDSVGLRGSPTQMLNVFTPPVGRKGEVLQGTPNEVAAALLKKLHAERIL